MTLECSALNGISPPNVSPKGTGNPAEEEAGQVSELEGIQDTEQTRLHRSAPGTERRIRHKYPSLTPKLSQTVDYSQMKN